MAVVKVISSKASLKGAYAYITKEEKTESCLIECVNCSKENPYKDMQMVKQIWGKTDGRQYKHFVVSFPPGEKISEESALQVAMSTLDRYADDFQMVFAVHKDREHLHVHALVNSVSMVDGHKFQMDKRDLQQIKDRCNNITRSMGLSVPEKGKTFDGQERDSVTAYNKEAYHFLKAAEQNPDVPSYVQNIAIQVFTASKKARSKKEFIDILEENGISTIWEDSRKYITFTDKARELHGEAKCKIRNNKLDTYYGMDFGKETLLHGFEVNAQRADAERAAEQQLASAINSTEPRAERADTDAFLRELSSEERASAKVADDSIAKQEDRRIRAERLRIEAERRAQEASKIAREQAVRAGKEVKSISRGNIPKGPSIGR